MVLMMLSEYSWDLVVVLFETIFCFLELGDALTGIPRMLFGLQAS
jgi:hypothetical protein